jgi:hypothetical protein
MAKEVTEAAVAAEQPRTVVYLGNRNTISVIDGERVPAAGKRCTTIVLRPDATLLEAAQEITGANGVWQAHSDGTPAWVAAEGPLGEALAQLLSAHYKIEVREPDPGPGA